MYKGSVSPTGHVRVFAFASVSQLLLGFTSPLIRGEKTQKAAETLRSISKMKRSGRGGPKSWSPSEKTFQRSPTSTTNVDVQQIETEANTIR